MNSEDLIYIFKWWATIFLIGSSFLPLTSTIFSKFIDKGYLFSKVFGILILSYCVYVLGTLKILQFNLLNIVIVWAILIILQLLFFRKRKLKLRNFLKIFLLEEAIFLAALFFWSWIRTFQPDIRDLEKFMDFGFVNSILRSDYFPARDMWLTPLSINYYYFGHLYTAVVTKISQIPSFITFNLMIATLFAFTFSLSFSLGINLVQTIKKLSMKKTILLGLFFGYIVSFSGNLQTIYSFFKSYNGESPIPFWDLILSISTFPNGYWYPNATRFIYHTIHEFPSYSFVVADIHGHVLSIPIVISLIAIALLVLLENRIRISIVVLVAFLISTAYMTNAWDGLIYFGLFLNVLFFVVFINDKSKEIFKRATNSALGSLKYILLIVVLFLAFSFVFNQNFSPFASGIGINCAPEFLLKIESFGPLVFERNQCQHSPFWQLFILYGFFLYMITSFLIFLRKRRLIVSDYFVLIITFISVLLIIVPEFIYLKDIYTGHFRANTMFKLAYQAFIMFSFSSIYILIRIFSQRKEFKTRVSKILFVAFLIGTFFLIFLISIYPYFAIPSGYGNLEKNKSLDGTAYLKQTKPGDFSAINWLNQNISGQPVILEAQGDSYTDYARISANTGLPTVLGWTVHEWLWRGGYDVPSARFSDIQNLYETSNINQARRIIEKFDISYIYVGGLEREKYKISEDKFRKIGELVYSREGVNIYKIN